MTANPIEPKWLVQLPADCIAAIRGVYDLSARQSSGSTLSRSIVRASPRPAWRTRRRRHLVLLEWHQVDRPVPSVGGHIPAL